MANAEADFGRIRNKIMELVLMGNRSFIVYPFGRVGILTKQVLNELFGIEAKYYVDRDLSIVNNKIKSLEQLSEADRKDNVFLLTNNSWSIYDNLMETGVPDKNIINLFGDDSLYVNDIFLEMSNKVNSILDVNGYLIKDFGISREIYVENRNRRFSLKANLKLDTIKDNCKVLFPVHRKLYDTIWDKKNEINSVYDVAFFWDDKGYSLEELKKIKSDYLKIAKKIVITGRRECIMDEIYKESGWNIEKYCSWKIADITA